MSDAPKNNEKEASDISIPDEWVEAASDLTDIDIALHTVLDTVNTDIDYIAQLSAAHDLLQREKIAEQLSITQIRKSEDFIKTAIGILDQMHAEDMWIDDIHRAIYQDAARSMAAVGMLAPLAESLFYHSFRGIHRVFDEHGISVGSHTHSQQDWDCHFFLKKNGRRKKALAAGIIQLAESIGLDTHLPNNLRHTLQALFTYRNNMFHGGFEWSMEKRRCFQKQLTRWPSDWFSMSTNGDESGIFYMTDTFIEHCSTIIYLVLGGVGVYVRRKIGI